MNRTRTLGSPVRLFASWSAAIVVTELLLVRTPLFAQHSDVASWGITFDLTMTVPALYYLFVVRSGRARALTLAPVFVACMSAAAMIVPRGGQAYLHQLRFIAVPLDILTLVLVVRRVVGMRSAPGTAPHDAYARIRQATEAIFGKGIAASVATVELTLAWYGLFCWRAQPSIPPDARAITVYRRSEWSSVVACFVVLIAFESAGVHLLVQHWSVTAAWVITSLDLYGMLWLIGDYHAIRLRPTLVRDETIEFRHGLRCSVSVRRDNIAAVEPIRSEADWKRKATLKLAMLDEPRYLIRFREPVVAQGLGGMSRTIDSVAILPDDEAAFLAALP